MQVLARHVLTFLRSFYSCSQKYKKVWHFLRKTLDICLRFGYNNTRRQGHGPRRKEYADVAELADALDSGSSSLKRVWVQIPSSAPKSSNVCSGIFCFSDLFWMTSIVPRTVGADSISARGAGRPTYCIINHLEIYKGGSHYVHPKRNPQRYRIPAQLPGL